MREAPSLRRKNGYESLFQKPVLFKKPNPTADQWREARDMLVELKQLFEAGNEAAYAAAIAEVLSGGQSALGKWLTSGDFWGGMGSLVDSAFCTPSGLGRERDINNSREFIKLIVRLGRHQLRSGIYTGGLLSPGIKPHIQTWTELFELTLDDVSPVEDLHWPQRVSGQFEAAPKP